MLDRGPRPALRQVEAETREALDGEGEQRAGRGEDERHEEHENAGGGEDSGRGGSCAGGGYRINGKSSVTMHRPRSRSVSSIRRSPSPCLGLPAVRRLKGHIGARYAFPE